MAVEVAVRRLVVQAQDTENKNAISVLAGGDNAENQNLLERYRLEKGQTLLYF